MIASSRPRQIVATGKSLCAFMTAGFCFEFTHVLQHVCQSCQQHLNVVSSIEDSLRTRFITASICIFVDVTRTLFILYAQKLSDRIYPFN